MRPFWLRPKWVVGHVLALVLVGLFVNFGFWQLRRHAERADRNATVEARMAESPAPLGEVVDPDAALSVGDAVQYRRATAGGTYDTEGEVLVRSRSLDGRPGYHVVTPLVLDDGRAVLVNRGFLPQAGDDLDALRRSAGPPEGRVKVAGLVLATEERRGIGPKDPDPDTAGGARLDQVARLDIARIQAQVPQPLYPVYLQLQDQRPAQPDTFLTVLPEPDQDAGPHLSYAAQWFIFATVGAVGWPVLLRRTAKDKPPAPGPPGPGGRADLDRGGHLVQATR